ncbi:beta-ketothiolase [Salipiger bermudensis HTCC2601]|uniref:Beta-ketothiolase n=1 Tax=Salipiger bermudensis (strain DSM 26914 / JCM 13377 / KCTC 12554 / HTCC2601) TaxID=314265 RepID=Q0FVY9_SALBH|nr:beta-ketothiolase [Salipiger bermudensis HTCC2601]
MRNSRISCATASIPASGGRTTRSRRSTS